MEKILDKMIEHYESLYGVKFDESLRKVINTAALGTIDDIVKAQAERLKDEQRLSEYGRL